MTILGIYQHFQTPLNLQEHMLRVGALAEIVTANWTGEPIEKSSIIQACLLHDIAKPLNFDLEKQARFGLSEADIQTLANLQELLRTKYDPREHQAAVKICQEVGCSPVAVQIVDDLEWEYVPRLLNEHKTHSLVAIYCDMRITPVGIAPLIDRMNELKTRDHSVERMDELSLAGQALEKWLQGKVSIDLNAISNEQINARIGKLKEFSFGV